MSHCGNEWIISVLLLPQPPPNVSGEASEATPMPVSAIGERLR
ncbi:hypothetical protein [Chlorogloeopsis sp. ULAP02]